MDITEVTGKGKILLMDDDEGVRFIAGRTLEHMGYGVDHAEEGLTAIELYRKALESGAPYVAVILDLTIPGGMGGKEVLDRLKEIDPAVKGFVSSGYQDDPMMKDFAAYGFSGAITKPFRYEDMVTALKQAFGVS